LSATALLILVIVVLLIWGGRWYGPAPLRGNDNLHWLLVLLVVLFVLHVLGVIHISGLRR